MRESVEITMLGKFTIFGPGMAAPKAVSLTGRARRLWILTAYLILTRDRGVSARELIDLLWPDSESSDPMATLQNNVSRARNALEELGLRDGKKLICNRSGTYYWAPNTETVLDCEQFRTALRACLDEVGNIKDEALAARAIGMYSDDFLPECATDSWCVNTNAYYHASYLQLCRKMTAHLLDRQAYAEVGQICRRVLGLDPAAEEFAVRLMQALTRSGMPDKALEYYDYISKLYLETYAVPPSQELEAEKAIAVQQRYGGAGRKPAGRLPGRPPASRSLPLRQQRVSGDGPAAAADHGADRRESPAAHGRAAKPGAARGKACPAHAQNGADHSGKPAHGGSLHAHGGGLHPDHAGRCG